MNGTRERPDQHRDPIPRKGPASSPGRIRRTGPTYLLAGGRSSRFGSDKARAPWRGTTLLEANAKIARATGADVTVVAREADAYADLGLRTISDVYPECGPLAGIHAAICDAAPEPWVLIVACDLAGVRPSWLEALWTARRDGVDAVLFGAADEQPLLGAYAHTLVPRIERALEDGGPGVFRFLASCAVEVLPRPSGWTALRNLNSETEWRQASAAAKASS